MDNHDGIDELFAVLGTCIGLIVFFFDNFLFGVFVFLFALLHTFFAAVA